MRFQVITDPLTHHLRPNSSPINGTEWGHQGQQGHCHSHGSSENLAFSEELKKFLTFMLF